MTGYTTISIHLGEGAEGRFRKLALEQLAREAGCIWGSEPSIGRWICELADQKRTEHEITVKNYRRSRKFGWGWTTTPTGEDAYSIELPDSPMYTGTLNQLDEARADDRAFHSLGGAFYNTAYFYDGRRITHSWAFTLIHRAEDLLFDPESDDYDAWSKRNAQHHWDNDKYGWAWVSGFNPPEDDFDVKIRIE